MTNLGFTGKEITKKLDTKTIRKGGLVTVTMPIIKCDIGERKTEFGGYTSLVHYNKSREEEHKKEKMNKRSRSLNRQIKRIGSCRNGDELPSPETHLNLSKRLKS